MAVLKRHPQGCDAPHPDPPRGAYPTCLRLAGHDGAHSTLSGRGDHDWIDWEDDDA